MGVTYKRAGVILTDIHPKEATQVDLFDVTDRDRLMKVVDALNATYGQHKVMRPTRGLNRS